MDGELKQFEERLSKALALDVAYSERVRDQTGTPAAVLALFGFDPAHGISLFMTRRTDKVETHKGQMAFPGGICEQENGVCEEPVPAALRETEEEVGIPREAVKVIGRLPVLYTATQFRISPVVATLELRVADVALKVSADEIAEAFWIPLSVLTSDGTYRREVIEAGPIRYPIHVYQVGPHRIWGATGAMIKNLLDRLACVQPR